MRPIHPHQGDPAHPHRQALTHSNKSDSLKGKRKANSPDGTRKDAPVEHPRPARLHVHAFTGNGKERSKSGAGEVVTGSKKKEEGGKKGMTAQATTHGGGAHEAAGGAGQQGQVKPIDARVMELVVAMVPVEGGQTVPTEEQRKLGEQIQGELDKAIKQAEE